MSAHLEFKNVPFSIDLADPFFFSQAEFTFSVGRDVERQLNDFMKEFTRVLPDVVAALETGASHLEMCAKHR
jgi:hypothetical protein